MKKTLFSLVALLGVLTSAPAALIPFDLVGTAGAGLLPGNEPGSVTGGTGGEIGTGIRFDDVNLTLEINVGWGSNNGFTDLTGNATASHIHGPTASNFGNGFTQTAGVLFNLPRVNSTANAGYISTTVGPLTAGQVTDLFNGKWYINIHTAANSGGEARGFLVAVPEPSAVALGALGAGGLLALRLRRKN
jgi:hypothetical protein